jgi:hypothetical protein
MDSASQLTVKRNNWYWIWFVGSAAWFVDAALSLHRRAVGWGLLETLTSATFLAVGMYFRKQGS